MLTVSGMSVYAQQDSTSTSKEKKDRKFKFDSRRITYGGGVGGTIGATTAITISPVVAYRFTDNFYAGPRLIYNYYGNRHFSYSNYGVGLLARYFPKGSFFLQSEYQQLFVRIDSSARYSVPILFVGAGYYNRPFVFSVLYNLLWTPRSPQVSPLQVNFGVMF